MNILQSTEEAMRVWAEAPSVSVKETSAGYLTLCWTCLMAGKFRINKLG
ncbi:hypothetical protein [Estrella lausannensis]|nr:hypothetical protein [Estrella lausannensis]